MAAADAECAGRAHWRRRFGFSVLSDGASQSGVALRLPPHSMVANSPFLDSPVFLSELLTAHEPENRNSLEINDPIFRFMGRRSS